MPAVIGYGLLFIQTATIRIYTLSLHDALPILGRPAAGQAGAAPATAGAGRHGSSRGVHQHSGPGAEGPGSRSEEHTSELQSRPHLVCRLLLEKKNQNGPNHTSVLEVMHPRTSP